MCTGMNPYSPALVDNQPNHEVTYWTCFLVYSIVFGAIYTTVVTRVAGPTVVATFKGLAPFQRLEYVLQLADHPGLALIGSAPIWIFAQRLRISVWHMMLASGAAAVAYLMVFLNYFPLTYRWAVHGVPLGGARPFWPITCGQLVALSAAFAAGFPIIVGPWMLSRFDLK